MTFGDLKTSTGSIPGSPASGSIKIVWQEEIRRLPLRPEADLQSIRELCASCFGIKNLSGLAFTYQDSEGDTVTLSSIEELRELAGNSPGAVKLTLFRKVNKAKQPPAVLQAQPGVEAAQPEGQKAEKKSCKRDWKEKKQQLKKEIVHSKVVRLRWRTAAPEATSSTTPKPNDKGCYVTANLNGKVQFGAGSKGNNGLWLIHELSNGEIILAPLKSAKSHLRVFPEGKVDLTKCGAGPRARWSLVKAEDKSTISLSSISDDVKVQLSSHFVPGFHLSVVQEFNKKNKPVLRAKGLSDTTSSTFVLASEFTLEIQDPMVTMVKFAKNITNKKKAIKNALRKKEEKDEEKVLGFKKNKNNNKKSKKDPNWASMTKQQRMEAKATRKLEKLEKKRLKMEWKM